MSILLLFAFICFQFVAGDNWAVLVAGSNGFWNYRHQADIAHAYQILIAGGMSPDKIITMMYDDVAASPSNPFPGKLFNHPTDAGVPGKDNYAGMKIDYKGASVTPANFINVLTGGNSTAGPVLKSGPTDNVFIYFADHGGRGLICFPSENLDSGKLISTLEAMHQNKMYSKLVFYLEACESGSMFDGLLKPETNIYAITAAGDDESSWGWYCGVASGTGSSSVNGTAIGSCLGDLFSISWMEDTEAKNPANETLAEQFVAVKNLTSKSGVHKFGDFTFDSLPIGAFVAPKRKQQQHNSASSSSSASSRRGIDSRDIKLFTLRNWEQEVIKAGGRHYLYGTLEEVSRMVKEEENSRATADRTFNMLWQTIMGANNGEMLEYLPRRNHVCVNDVMDSYTQTCGKFTDYSLKYVGTIVNMCERGVDANVVISALKSICTAN